MDADVVAVPADAERPAAPATRCAPTVDALDDDDRDRLFADRRHERHDERRRRSTTSPAAADVAAELRHVDARRRRLRRRRPRRAERPRTASPASRPPTASSSTRTSGCSPRSTRAPCSTATRRSPGGPTPSTPSTSTCCTRDGDVDELERRPTTPTTCRAGPAACRCGSAWRPTAPTAYTEAVETTLRVAREGAALVARRAAPRAAAGAGAVGRAVPPHRAGTPPTYQAWSDEQLATPAVVRHADGVAGRDRAALVHREPADDRRRPRRRSSPASPTDAARWLTPIAPICVDRRRALRGHDGRRARASSPAAGWRSPTGSSTAVGTGDRRRRRPTIDATDCLVTPGLVNTHHHLFQNLTRAYPPMTDKPLFGWLQSLYPLWRGARHRGAPTCRRGSAWPSWRCRGCTTSTDHLYLHPRGAGDLLGAEIDAARDLGVRFHPTRGSMSLSREGRRPAARRRRGRRRRHPRRQRGRRRTATTTARTGR